MSLETPTYHNAGERLTIPFNSYVRLLKNMQNGITLEFNYFFLVIPLTI